MKLKSYGPNQIEIIIPHLASIFFSYDTAVAGEAELPDGTRGLFRTDKYVCRSTTKHIEKYIGRRSAETAPENSRGATTVPQEWIESLLN